MEEELTYAQRYYRENKQFCIQRTLESRRKNPEHYRQYMKDWYEKHKITKAEYNNRWKREKRAKLRAIRQAEKAEKLRQLEAEKQAKKKVRELEKAAEKIKPKKSRFVRKVSEVEIVSVPPPPPAVPEKSVDQKSFTITWD
jgi:hypothetical protein